MARGNSPLWEAVPRGNTCLLGYYSIVRDSYSSYFRFQQWGRELRPPWDPNFGHLSVSIWGSCFLVWFGFLPFLYVNFVCWGACKIIEVWNLSLVAGEASFQKGSDAAGLVVVLHHDGEIARFEFPFAFAGVGRAFKDVGFCPLSSLLISPYLSPLTLPLLPVTPFGPSVCSNRFLFFLFPFLSAR